MGRDSEILSRAPPTQPKRPGRGCGTRLAPALDGMSAIRHIRIHGRGGEGVKLASRIVSRALFLGGFTVQDSPLYGAERRGAPVVAFVRFGRGPILERGYITSPDVVAIMDDSLLSLPEAGVLDGIHPATLVLVNAADGNALAERHRIAARVVTCDLSAIALAVLGAHLLSAPMAGATLKAAVLASRELLLEAVRIELVEVGIVTEMLERNLVAATRAFDQAAAVGLGSPPGRTASAVAQPFSVPHLAGRIATPLISTPASSALRSTEGWRVYRPVIELARCTRCFLCFALCPEGAIGLDAESYPHVDYAHCKGCLVCVAECPPRTIAQVREAA
jgi:pyruvate ferredoxin oxidoreductase gamma subunit